MVKLLSIIKLRHFFFLSRIRRKCMKTFFLRMGCSHHRGFLCVGRMASKNSLTTRWPLGGTVGRRGVIPRPYRKVSEALRTFWRGQREKSEKKVSFSIGRVEIEDSIAPCEDEGNENVRTKIPIEKKHVELSRRLSPFPRKALQKTQKKETNPQTF